MKTHETINLSVSSFFALEKSKTKHETDHLSKIYKSAHTQMIAIEEQFSHRRMRCGQA